MKTVLTLVLLFGLCGLSALAGESGENDHERPLVKQGVLGTVNVLRELDVRTWKNRVTAKGDADFSRGWWGGPVECTIDGSGMGYLPAKNPRHWVATYTLPGLRTVSSLAIAYHFRGDYAIAPDTMLLEGSGDGGATWFEVFKSKPRKQQEFVKCFKPVKVNMLRLTQEGGNPHTVEVMAYADFDAPGLPLFGGKDNGAFSFLRELCYRDKLKWFNSPETTVWAKSAPRGGIEVPFDSRLPGWHDGTNGCWEPNGLQTGQQLPGKRVFIRYDLDKAYQMNYGLISGQDEVAIIGVAECKAEFYTANGRLDPSTLKGNSIEDLTGQGWVLQKAWAKDPEVCKGFPFARPGKYNQMLVVWDAINPGNFWSHLEMFGIETPDAPGALKNPQK